MGEILKIAKASDEIPWNFDIPVIWVAMQSSLVVQYYPVYTQTAGRAAAIKY